MRALLMLPHCVLPPPPPPLSCPACLQPVPAALTAFAAAPTSVLARGSDHAARGRAQVASLDANLNQMPEIRGFLDRTVTLSSWSGWGSVALSRCTAAYPLHTIFATIIGTPIPEAAARPDPRSGRIARPEAVALSAFPHRAFAFAAEIRARTATRRGGHSPAGRSVSSRVIRIRV
jgi:hypothetical protein